MCMAAPWEKLLYLYADCTGHFLNLVINGQANEIIVSLGFVKRKLWWGQCD